MIIPRKPVADSYQLVSLADTAKDAHAYSVTEISHGRPARKPLFNALDSIALLVSLLCLAAAVVVVSPSLPYAAQLQYTKQIIVVGFLLGVMNQCLQRVAPQTFLLVEARFGRATLQNYDGILRWSPFADRLSIVWRAILVLFVLLPLALGILYKKFTGGVGSIVLSTVGGYYSPTAPPGLQNVGALSIMVNATVPYMAASTDDEAVPGLTDGPKAYGYNILLLSNTSAAALDGPVPDHVSQLQAQLRPASYSYLTADVRGTVAFYNATAEAHRHDDAFWDYYFQANSYGEGFNNVGVLPWSGAYFGILNIPSAHNGEPFWWNVSWAFLADYPFENGEMNNTKLLRAAFRKTALGFDVKRYPCRGTWKITRSSIELVSGHCDASPLARKYQYLEDCQLGLGGIYVQLLNEYLGPFGTYRNASQWKIPTFSVVTASMYSSRIASANGIVPIQPGGWLYMDREIYNTSDGQYNETYFVEDDNLSLEVPTLQAAGTLYIVLLIQPVLVIIAFLMTVILYEIPISRGFGMVSVLAGIDKSSLDLLKGAAFSGNIERDVGLKIRLGSAPEDVGGGYEHVTYSLGESGCEGRVKHRRKYD